MKQREVVETADKSLTNKRTTKHSQVTKRVNEHKYRGDTALQANEQSKKSVRVKARVRVRLKVKVKDDRTRKATVYAARGINWSELSKSSQR